MLVLPLMDLLFFASLDGMPLLVLLLVLNVQQARPV